jgi:2-C-methyl-D-erythritol 4-phosphate cytidylyltransferase
METVKTAAIITAGGMGLRLPGDVKKQFRLLGGKPLLIRTLEPFLDFDGISEIVITLPEADIGYFRELVGQYLPSAADKVKLSYCAGGAQRQDSVFNALKLLAADTGFVMIHDGVRPFVTEKLITELHTMARKYGAAIPGTQVKNTIKTIKDEVVDHTIRREILLQVHTPQVFHYEILMKCYHRAMKEGYYSTDDAAILEHYGYSVHYLTDSSFNLKITDELDFFMAEQIIKHKQSSLSEGDKQ